MRWFFGGGGEREEEKQKKVCLSSETLQLKERCDFQVIVTS